MSVYIRDLGKSDFYKSSIVSHRNGSYSSDRSDSSYRRRKYLNCDDTQNNKLWQNSKTKSFTKLKHPDFKKKTNQKLKLRQNFNKKVVIELKNSTWDKIKTQIMTKVKNCDCEKILNFNSNKKSKSDKKKVLRKSFGKNNLTLRQPMSFTEGSSLQ